MKIIKPLTASLLTRPYQWRGASRLGVAIYALIVRDEQGILFEPDQKLWAEVLPQLDSGGLLDQIMPKSQAEFLVSGHAYTAHQDDNTRCVIRIQVAGLEKTLLVHGDRYWNGDLPTKPEPFEKMPVTWSNAFGGPDFPDNPQGKGMRARTVAQAGLNAVPLPNVENPLKPVQKQSDRPPPASMGAIEPTRPKQLSKMGTYSETWEKYDFPGFLPDMDPSIFNMAPSDQQWSGQAGLPLGETFQISNMHPMQPCWEGTIPRLKARCFVQKRTLDAALEFEEVDNMQASTVWFVPDSQSMILMFHGSIDVMDTEADDVAVAMAAIEDMDTARPVSHYEQIMQVRLNPETAAHHHPLDDELVPAAMLRADRAINYREPQGKLGARVQAFVSRQQEGFKRWVQAQGIHYEDYIPEFVGPPEVFDTSLESSARQDQIVDSFKVQIQEQLRASEDPTLIDYADTLDADDFQDNGKQSNVNVSGPPDLDVIDAGMAASSAGSQEDRQAVAERARRTRDDVRKGYLYSAQYQDPAERLSIASNEPIRREVQRRCREGDDLTEMDLTGADLSGMDLSGADFSRSFMERVNLTGATLYNVNFNETVLVRAQFDDVQASGCNFSKASLAKATISGSVFYDCDWTETLCDDLEISRSTLKECRMTRLMVDDWTVRDAVLDGCVFDACMISESTLDSVKIRGGNWNKVAFTDTSWSHCVVENATWDSAAFTTCTISQCDWERSTLINMLMEDDVQLAECRWHACRLQECTFLEVRSERLAFTGSDLTESDFTKATLRESLFDSVVARDAIFHKADLQGSSFRNADLIQASLERSRLDDCNFDGATLFRTNVSKVSINARTRFRNSYRDQLEMHPIYRDGEQNLAQLMNDE